MPPHATQPKRNFQTMLLDVIKKIAPPPVHPLFSGSIALWKQICVEHAVPDNDELFEVLHAYGSGGFDFFENGNLVGQLTFMNAMEDPIMKGERMWAGDEYDTRKKRTGYSFFPEKDGLFPVMYSDEDKVYITDYPPWKVVVGMNRDASIKEFSMRFLQFMADSLQAKMGRLWSWQDTHKIDKVSFMSCSP